MKDDDDVNVWECSLGHESMMSNMMMRMAVVKPVCPQCEGTLVRVVRPAHLREVPRRPISLWWIVFMLVVIAIEVIWLL
jgi:uncharacterized protein with PIN domain